MEAGAEVTCHIKRSLNALKNLPRVASYNIKDLPGAKKAKNRRGRGPGSGKGKTSGRGHKGQGQRGTKTYFQFEGGQTPFYRLVPKHGHGKSKLRNIEYSRLNLDRLQYFIDSGRIDPNETITMRVMRKSGLVQGRISDGVKLLGMGADWFEAKIDIEVSLASKTAIDAVERQGGSIKCVYYDKVGLRAYIRPETLSLPLPRQARPPPRLMKVYADPERRGFLADPDEIEKVKRNGANTGELVKAIEDLQIK